MSFQDVRRRQHPIFDNHRRSGHSINAPTLQTMERTDYKSSRRQSPITQQSPREFQHKLQQRGVRPRLSTICPVTAKILMDDQASLGTQETAPSVDTLSSQDESDIPTILPLRHDMTSSRSLSIFAHLTTSIVNFQVRCHVSTKCNIQGFVCGGAGGGVVKHIAHIFHHSIENDRRTGKSRRRCWSFPRSTMAHTDSDSFGSRCRSRPSGTTLSIGWIIPFLFSCSSGPPQIAPRLWSGAQRFAKGIDVVWT